jgi:hypothetical protein
MQHESLVDVYLKKNIKIVFSKKIKITTVHLVEYRQKRFETINTRVRYGGIESISD